MLLLYSHLRLATRGRSDAGVVCPGAAPPGARNYVTGAQRWWHHTVDGWMEGWEVRARDMLARYSVDGEGYVMVDERRVGESECSLLPPMVQLAARARIALGSIDVVDGPAVKARVP